MGKKKHNYVNVPSTAETDEIMNDNLLSDDVRRDLIILHRIDKNIKSDTMRALNRIKQFIDNNNISISDDDKIRHIEITTHNSESEDMVLSLSVFFQGRYNKESLEGIKINNMTFITSTVEMTNDTLIVSKFGAIKYCKNNSKINDVMYIEASFII